MRSNWTGQAQIGLLNIGIKLGSATTDNGPELKQVRTSDGSPITYKRHATADGEEVAWADVSRGYYAPDGSLVVLTDDDFTRAYGEKNRLAEIVMFAPDNQVPRIASKKFHLVQPDKGSEKTYALLARVLRKTERVAVLTFAMRQREILAVLRPYGDGYLILEELEYAADVLTPDFEAPKQNFSEAEEDMATRLIDQMRGDFDHAAYADKSAEALAAVIQDKLVNGNVVAAPVVPAQPTGAQQATDLMAMLAAAVKDKTPTTARKRNPRRASA